MLYERIPSKTFYSYSSESINGNFSYIKLVSKSFRIVREGGSWYQEEKVSYGSAVQWNEDYLVTARHVSFVEKTVYVSQVCDVRFVKKKVDGSPPEWRERVPNELLKFIGVSKLGRSLIVAGADLDIASRTVHNSVVDVCLATGGVEVGMSGGPVYADDGKVVGILSGFTSGIDVGGVRKRELIEYESQSFPVYVPFSLIKAEWDKFKSSE